MRTNVVPFEGLHLERFVAVTFIFDYLQFQFDNANMTAYNPVSAKVGGHIKKQGEIGFADAITSLVGEDVTSFIVEDRVGIQIGLKNGAEITISLREKDFIGPEAAYLSAREFNNLFIVFRFDD